MTTVTDDLMMVMIAKTGLYSLVILKTGPNASVPGTDKIIWEHARQNFELRRDVMLSIVCPVSDESAVNGVGIFNASVEEAKSIMDEDPAVKAGILVYEIHPCRSFPGDCLP